MIDQVLKVSDNQRTLIINAGNNFNLHSRLPEIEAQCIISGLNMTGVDVIGIGPWDLLLGRDKLKRLAESSPADIVCANIDGFLPFVRFSKDNGKVKVLVTSVIDPQLLKNYKVEFEDLKATEPKVVIKRLQREIKHDIFIVITHARGERNQEILSGCRGIDLVIDGESGRTGKSQETFAGRPLVVNNIGGQYVAYVDLVKGASGALEVTAPTNTRAIVKSFKEDPEVGVLVAQYREKRQQYIRAEREKLRLAALKNRKVADNLYLGSSWCGSCHVSIEKEWQKSGHAHAISSLEKKNRLNDPDCLKCHVTGLDDIKAVGGFVAMAVNPKMAGVQCEACHGPGGKHAQAPHKVKMKPLTEKDCRLCHNHETDPDFAFEIDSKKVDHGKDEKVGK